MKNKKKRKIEKKEKRVKKRAHYPQPSVMITESLAILNVLWTAEKTNNKMKCSYK